MKYISAVKKAKGCVFCRAQRIDSADYLIFETEKSICLLNIYPYNNGHLLISPRRHTGDIGTLTQEEATDIFQCLKRAKGLLDKVLKPQGYNIGFNLNRAAGAGITGHLHLHIVPRWEGDSNFMPVIGDAKIISQSLDELAKLLKNADKKNK
jgi:ATP adenylyltransferase